MALSPHGTNDLALAFIFGGAQAPSPVSALTDSNNFHGGGPASACGAVSIFRHTQAATPLGPIPAD